MEAALARRLWLALEPIHAVVYFEPTAKATYESVGLKGGWMGYFASRAAALGPVPPEVVTATFFNFAPSMVERAIPDAWRLAEIPDILSARRSVASAGLVRALGDDVSHPSIGEAASIARRAARSSDREGRPLYAAHAALDWPDIPLLDLWHAATLLREHRGDGHIAALVTHGLSGLQANVLISAGGAMPAEYQQRFRGWSPEEWKQAEADLAERDLLTHDGQLSKSGMELRRSVEDLTDRLALQPWDRIGAPDTERFEELVTAIASKVTTAGGVPYPNPMALPKP